MAQIQRMVKQIANFSAQHARKDLADSLYGQACVQEAVLGVDLGFEPRDDHER